MIIAIMAVYLTLLFAIVQLGIVRFNLFWKASPLIVLLLLNIGLFIPMDGARRRARHWSRAIRWPSCRASRERSPRCRSLRIRH